MVLAFARTVCRYAHRLASSMAQHKVGYETVLLILAPQPFSVDHAMHACIIARRLSSACISYRVSADIAIMP